MPRIAVVCAGLAWLCAAFNPVSASPLSVSSRADGEALVAAAPQEARSYLDYAAWLESQGELQESAAVLEAGCHRADDPSLVLLQLAGVYQQLGKLARAEVLAREVLVLLPELPAAHVRLGDIYLELGWSRSALESYEEAVRLGPGQSLPRQHLLSGLLEAGLTAVAEDRCLEFIAETPDDPHLWLALGQVFEKQDKLREAFTTYGQVLGLDPGSAEAYARQGRLFCRFGQFSPAADACRKALQLDEDNLVAHAYLGIACSYLGDGEQARHHALIAEAGGLNMAAVWKKIN